MLNPADYAKAGTEHAHQVALFMWAQQNTEQFPELRLMFAIPNGGERNTAVAGRLKAEGVKSGVPDIFLPVPMLGFHGLFIELKRPAGISRSRGFVSESQKAWLAELQKRGYVARVCVGWEAARDVLLHYLGRSDAYD